jgi:MFS family permease
VGAKRTMLLGLGMLAGSSVAFSVAETIVVLDTARFVQGVGGACSWAGGLAWLLSVAPRDRRGELIGAALGAAIFGVLLGPALGGAATETSPELVFGCVALLGALLFAWALYTPSVPTEAGATWSDLATALRGGHMLMAVWLFTLPALFSGVIDVLVPLRLDDLGAAGITIGAAFLVAASIEGVLSPVLGRFSDRHGRLLPLRFGLAGAIVMAILLPIPQTVGTSVAALVLTVAALGCFWAPAAALLSDASEAAKLDQGFGVGLMNLAWAGGQVVGGAAGGALADVTADAVPYALLALLSAATLAAVRERRAVTA